MDAKEHHGQDRPTDPRSEYQPRGQRFGGFQFSEDPWYHDPRDLAALVGGFTDKVLGMLGEPAGEGWRAGELE